MASKILISLAVSSLGLSACFNAPITSEGSVTLAGQGAKLAAAGTTEVKSVSTIDSNSTSDIQLAAPVIEGMEGAGVTIAPGSLGISVDLVVEQAADISDTSMMSEMGLAEDIQISSATLGMIIRPSENVDLKKPLSIAMPLPVGLSFHLATGSKYAVFYKYFDPNEQKLVTGMKIADGESVKLSFDDKSGKDILSFEGYFGAYWAAILSREVVTAEVPPQKPAEQPIMNKSNVPVISSSGIVKETEIVKTQAVAELVWAKPSVKLIPETRSYILQASVPADQKVSACKADLFESATAVSGLVLDASAGTQIDVVLQNPKAHNIVGRFRCLDSLGRITVTPWSDSVAVPAVPTAPVVVTSPGVEASTASLVSISGVLKPVSSLLLIKTTPDKSDPHFIEVPVDPTGYFSVPVDRGTTLAYRVANKLSANPIVRDAALAQDVSQLFGIPLAEATDHVTNESETELKEEILPEVNEIIAKGFRYNLVAYAKSSTNNRISEATSFKFIGMPTPSGNTLFQFSDRKLKGHVRLGELKTDIASDEIVSLLASSLALNETADIQNGVAAMGRTVKGLRNSYMNNGWQADPTYTWRSERFLDTIVGTYTLASEPIYYGYGFHIENRQGPVPYSYDTICNGSLLPLEFIPPASVNVNNMGTPTPTSTFNNVDSYGSGPTGERTCQGTNFFAEERDTELMVNFGAGSSIQGQIPSGLWRYKFDGQELARFDYSYFKPFDAANNPTVFIPTFNLIKVGTDYVGATVRFSLYAGGSYLALTDLTVLRRLMSQAHFSLWSEWGPNFHQDLIFADGSAEGTVTFETPISESEATNASVEYSMGGQRYRFEVASPP